MTCSLDVESVGSPSQSIPDTIRANASLIDDVFACHIK